MPKKNIVEQAKKAMHLLFVRLNNLNLPIDIQLKLFDNTVFTYIYIRLRNLVVCG